MKPLLVMISMLFLAACASQPDPVEKAPPPTKADVQARDEFAKSLPKPPEH